MQSLARVPQILPIDVAPPAWPGTSLDDFRTAPDGLPARVVKAHNVHKAHYIKQYAHTVALAMNKKWEYRSFIDTYAGPGLCWVADSGEFVHGSPLIAAGASPSFTHSFFVDMDSRCTSALRQRLGSEPAIECGDSNSDEIISKIRAFVPRANCLSLALLDPQGCTLHLETIRKLSEGRPMDLLINLPIHSLYRCLAASDWHVLDNVLGAGWPDLAKHGVPGWRAAVRDHYRGKLRELGYTHFAAKEVRSEVRKSPLYDFILASKHPRAIDLFEKVTQETALGQLALL